jgi:hypothetical protein
MHLRNQTVEGSHPVTVRQQFFRNVCADEACATRYQDVFSHVSSITTVAVAKA